ncbi:hypothetical protein [Pyrodictium abyssi]|uniref:Uncharacterized protein n=1 Tax=Pyrodictium abyssi TaxID=54256 RepID=A0ABN6ZPT9_9CREN|nr:hypothetical protein PABY_18240 [Pyrodictium abyssi]
MVWARIDPLIALTEGLTALEEILAYARLLLEHHQGLRGVYVSISIEPRTLLDDTLRRLLPGAAARRRGAPMAYRGVAGARPPPGSSWRRAPGYQGRGAADGGGQGR